MASAYEHDMTPADVTDGAAKEEKKEHGHGHSHDHDDDHIPEIVALGCVTVGGATFTIDREGQIEAGKDTTFGVELVGAAKAVPSGAWLANPDGEKLCDPVVSEDHAEHWHFTVCPLMPVKKSKFVLSVGKEEATVDFAHQTAPCNGGILSVFKGVGFCELKLHDDAGDLELWLYTKATWQAKRKPGKPTPFDIPKETVVTLTFPSHAGKSVELRVRNMEQNEDEDGKPNMRGGATNYFVFPGESGQDPEWLMGEKWRGLVTVAFTVAVTIGASGGPRARERRALAHRARGPRTAVRTRARSSAES